MASTPPQSVKFTVLRSYSEKFVNSDKGFDVKRQKQKIKRPPGV